MSENETTNAQDGQQDTAARVMEAIGGIVAKLGVCHDNAKTEADAWEFRKIRTELAALLPALEHGLRTPAPASDTVSKVVALWDEMTAALRAWYPDSVTHPSNRLADKADALRPELERLLARPTVPTDSDTARRVAEIRERERKATMGPWEAVTTERKPSALGLEKGISGAVLHNVRTAWKHGQSKCKELIAYLTISPYYEPVHMVTMDPQDAEFIAHARADVPWLLDTVDALLAERDTLQQALAQQAGKVERLKAAIGSHPLREALARQEQDTLAALAELDEMRAERDAARAECERLRAELAAIRAAMLEDVARDVDGLLEQAERFRRNPIIEAQSRAHNTEASK